MKKKKWRHYWIYPKKDSPFSMSLIPHITICRYPDSEATSPFTCHIQWLCFGFAFMKINWNHYWYDQSLTQEQKIDMWKNQPKPILKEFTFPLNIWIHIGLRYPQSYACFIEFLFWKKHFYKINFKK